MEQALSSLGRPFDLPKESCLRAREVGDRRVSRHAGRLAAWHRKHGLHMHSDRCRIVEKMVRVVEIRSGTVRHSRGGRGGTSDVLRPMSARLWHRRASTQANAARCAVVGRVRRRAWKARLGVAAAEAAVVVAGCGAPRSRARGTASNLRGLADERQARGSARGQRVFARGLRVGGLFVSKSAFRQHVASMHSPSASMIAFMSTRISSLICCLRSAMTSGGTHGPSMGLRSAS